MRSVNSPPLSRPAAPATLSRLRVVERVAAAGQVGARAEAPPGARDDDRAHVVVCVRPSNAARSSAPIRAVHAFSRSGRFSVIVSTPSAASVVICS